MADAEVRPYCARSTGSFAMGIFCDNSHAMTVRAREALSCVQVDVVSVIVDGDDRWRQGGMRTHFRKWLRSGRRRGEKISMVEK